MNKFNFALCLGLLAGCGSVTPNYDVKFGDALRTALARQTINPDAGRNADAAAGIEGAAAHETLLRYMHSFKEPPPVVNVININGGIGNTGGK